MNHQLITSGQFVLLLLALLSVLSRSSAKSKGQISGHIKEEDLNCDTKNNEKIDRKMAQVMVFGEHGRRYPEDRKQLKTFCE